METGAATENFESFKDLNKDAMAWLMYVAIPLHILANGAAFGFILYLRSLQMIIHLPLMSTLKPSNVNSYFTSLVPIVQFDILDAEWTTEYVFVFDYPQHEHIEEKILD